MMCSEALDIPKSLRDQRDHCHGLDSARMLNLCEKDSQVGILNDDDAGRLCEILDRISKGFTIQHGIWDVPLTWLEFVLRHRCISVICACILRKVRVLPAACRYWLNAALPKF